MNDILITGIRETHPHADFVNSYQEFLEIVGGTIYASKIVDATYPHQSFDAESKQTFFGGIQKLLRNLFQIEH